MSVSLTRRNAFSRAPSSAAPFVRLITILSAPLLGSCWQNALAPQDATIVFVVVGLPNDPLIAVSAFVQDLSVSSNRATKIVAMGGSVAFDKLGAGFDIEVGITNVAAHNCRVVGIAGTTLLANGSTFVDAVRTGQGSVDTVTATLTCRSASVDLQVSGLPAGDSAIVDVSSVGEPQPAAPTGARVGNGTTRVAVFPDNNVVIAPFRLIASGRIYQAGIQTVAVASRQVAVATVQYAPIPQPGSSDVLVRLTGVPPDTGVRLSSFVRAMSATSMQSSQIGIGQSVSFPGLAAGLALDVGIDGLSAFACVVTSASHPTTTSGTATIVSLTTIGTRTDTVTFGVKCRAASLDIVVAGLPASDSATIDLVSPVDSLTRRAPNGTARVSLVPHDSVRVVPAPVTGADGRTYTAGTQSATLRRSATGTVTVQYQAPASSCPIDRPIAWYPLNGNANDASGNTLHGTLVGPVAAMNRNGSANSALLFDGIDDRIDLGDRFNTLAVPFSIAMWVFRPVGGAAEFRSLFVSDDEQGRYAGFFFQVGPSGQLQITYADGGTPGAGFRRSLDANAPIPTGAWVHVAATVRGPTDMTLFVNGTSVAGTFTGTGGPMVHTAFPARIGSFSLIAANRPWLGSLDDVRLYACSLDARDVPALMVVP